MAEEIRIERRGARPGEPARELREPETTGEARQAIEETRGRISAALDEIEDRIGEKREEIKERVDVLRPVRERMRARPWAGVGVALGAGLLVGLATGGGRERKRPRGMLDEGEREELRRWRAERRERMRGRMGRRRAGRGRSVIGQIAGAAMSGVVSGLAIRARRMGMGGEERTRG